MLVLGMQCLRRSFQREEPVTELLKTTELIS